MFVRALVCATVALCLLISPTATASNTAQPYYAQVHKVDCSEGTGTAFLTDHGWISVNHVTSIGGCSIDGHPIAAERDRDLDFSTVKVDLTGRGLKINCDGMKVGTYVWAVGYAGGFDWQTTTRMLVTYKLTEDGLRVLLGPHVIPGMSGGPIMNAEGEVVGTVNRYSPGMPLSYSVELKDTAVCRPQT